MFGLLATLAILGAWSPILVLGAVSSQTLFGLPTKEPAQDSEPGRPLVNFQVARPLNFPSHLKRCTLEVVHHNFGNSYYRPAIAEWTPPTDKCGSSDTWAGVSLNYTATSNGTQYDRLSAVTFHNVEIWRTSTAEPSPGPGIIWAALKDVTHYLPLFKKSGRLILDLNNIVDKKRGLDGEYDVRLEVTIYSDPTYDASSGPEASDVIIPLSNYLPDQANYVAVPPALKTVVRLPRNSAEAYVEIYASGTAQEEFWYFSVVNDWLPYLPEGAAYGQGPFREIRVLVDELLAGVALPYPILFTGAYIPLAWRPVAAYGAFDQPTYKVDLTPFIPLLADGKDHVITLEVVSAEPDHAILESWWISGNVQVILDRSSLPTVGKITTYAVPEYAVSKAEGVILRNGRDVNITLEASHQLRIEAELVCGTGRKTVIWQQSLEYTNIQSYQDMARVQVSQQRASGHSVSYHNGITKIRDSFYYPLRVHFWEIEDENVIGWGTDFDHTYERSEVHPLQVANSIQTRRYAGGTRVAPLDGSPRVSTAYGEQIFNYSDENGMSYSRTVKSANGTIVEDSQDEMIPQSTTDEETSQDNVRIHKPHWGLSGDSWLWLRERDDD